MSDDPMPPTRIRATCPDCGEVELTPTDVELRVCRVEEHSHDAFACPERYRVVSKPADQRVERLLTSGGVPAQPWDPPGEAPEPRSGPALTRDDLLDLHLELQSPDWWARFEAACR
jgi:hypothetical protein